MIQSISLMLTFKQQPLIFSLDVKEGMPSDEAKVFMDGFYSGDLGGLWDRSLTQ
jgi:hypothetical protein